jgi:NADH:ubiquinone oxidoreductase subunit F (NADH-binding)
MAIKILTRNMDVPNLTRIDVYESLGGYQGLRKAFRELSPAAITEMVKKSGLR